MFGEYGNFPHGPDGTSLAHYRSETGLGDWKLVDKKAVNPNPDGGRQFGTGDPTIAKIRGDYYIYCDLEQKGVPYRIMGWKSSDINEPFKFIGIVAGPRFQQTRHFDNHRIQDPDIAYIPDLSRYVMVINMKDHDGVPGGVLNRFRGEGHLRGEQTRVVGFLYSEKEIDSEESKE